MKKLLIAIGVAGVVFGTVFAFAATLNVSSNELAAGDKLVAPCDTTGHGVVSYTTAYQTSPAGYAVTKVKITGLDSACNGQTASATLTGTAGGASLGAGSASVASGAVEITVSPQPLASAVGQVYVVVTGALAP